MAADFALRKLMPPDLITFDLQATDKAAAIKELAQKIKDAQHINDLDTYLNAVFKREEEYTTGIGNGVAIPHGKTAAVLKSSLAFGRSNKGITYNSMDNKPVYLIFLIAVPENSSNEHLQILSQIARKLMHEENRQAILKAQSPEELYQVFES